MQEKKLLSKQLQVLGLRKLRQEEKLLDEKLKIQAAKQAAAKAKARRATTKRAAQLLKQRQEEKMLGRQLTRQRQEMTLCMHTRQAPQMLKAKAAEAEEKDWLAQAEQIGVLHCVEHVFSLGNGCECW